MLSYLEVVRIAREITAAPTLVMPRAEWLDSADHKAENFRLKDEIAGLGGMSLVSMQKLAELVADKIQKPVQIYVAKPEELVEIIEIVKIIRTHADIDTLTDEDKNRIKDLISQYDANQKLDEKDFILQNLKHAHGYVINREHDARVMITPDNTCWERFPMVKELMHLYAGMACDAETPQADMIVQCAKDARKVIPDCAAELDEEAAAFYMAIEVMIPWCLRNNQFWKLRETGTQADYHKIAKAFMLPQNIVEHFCDQATECYKGQGNLAGLSHEANAMIDNDASSP